jgi:glycosyltransferase involved in cell wall biosynthesis
MVMSAEVTVLMCVHNGEPFLKAAIDSICRQTFREFEFVIVNDGSDDGTAGILRKVSRDDERIVVVTQPRNRGLVACLNEGLGLARGRFIARMDADDIARPDRLEVELQAFQQNPSALLVTGEIEVLDHNTDTLTRGSKCLWNQRLSHWYLHFFNYVGGHGVAMYDRARVINSGGYLSTGASMYCDAVSRRLYEFFVDPNHSKWSGVADVVMAMAHRYTAAFGSRYAEPQLEKTLLEDTMSFVRWK